ncbi:MAG: D-2-hydroxyacid dehydrogenase [Clostridia bacterium]|nr:D-2-hydroxyacid dehydrogenase [Clostridia bacterium]
MRILVTDGMDKNAIYMLKQKGHEVIEKFYELEQLNTEIKNVDAVVIRSATKIRKQTIDSALETGRLKVIIRGGVGIDNIDHEYAQSHGIMVRNTPNASSVAVAELALAHMFAVTRFIAVSKVTMLEGKWNKNEYNGFELSGKTLGLIGFGRIAIELAKRAHALGMKVLYHNQSGEKKEFKEYRYATLEELLAESDYVSLHIPGNPEKTPYIDSKKIAMMKEGVYLINTSRGAVIDETALIEGLESGKVRGAGLDVYQEEPTKNMALISHERVSVTPHIGASTLEAQNKIGEEIVNIIESMEA